MKTLDICLRTHDDRNVHQIGDRGLTGISKQEIIFRCARSLAAAVQQVKNVSIKLLIIDDHSKADTLEGLLEIFNGVENESFSFLGIRHLTLTGNNASMVEWYEFGRASKADAVYLLEDDFLHEAFALEEMIWAFDDFTAKLKGSGMPASLFPYDDSDNYFPDWIEPCRVVPGQKSLWRTNTISTCSMFVTPQFINDNWEPIYRLAYNYGIIKGMSEETVFRPMWTQKTVLFTPLTMLAYHLTGKDHPVYDERPLWESFKST